MKQLLVIYKGLVCMIYKDNDKYYHTNSKWEKTEIKRDDFIFIA